MMRRPTIVTSTRENPIFTLFQVPLFLVFVCAVIGCVLCVRGIIRRKNDNQERIEVSAVVVKYSHLRNPARVTFDYPLPNGAWARAEKLAARMNYSHEGVSGSNAFWIQPGFRFPVYVNPHNPMDVELSMDASPANVMLIFGAVVSAMFAFGSLFFLALLNGFGMR